ncbi:MAG: ABC transporter ATP-binding protein [Kiloniellales bacterium]|nr:ABC transporter ATP-binding protein [Kiloniellales bacterium]
MTPDVVLRDITKSFGPTAVLRGVSLDIAEGEFLTLLGPSGCGKSTLLRIIAGLETQDDGAVSIGGRPVDALRPKQRDVAMVFQSYALYPHLTVAQNMALPLRMRRLSKLQRLPLLGRLMPGTKALVGAIAQDVAQTAAALEIDHLLDRKPGQLSGGQRQRVAVGRAMVRQPAVFLMDEPLSNLDAKLRVAMRAEIKELHRRLGVTFVYVTHDQAEAMTLSDRVAVMLEGELLQVARPRDIYADPEDRRVAEFVGSPKINLIDGHVREAGFVDAAGATLALDTGLDPGSGVMLGLRPEALLATDRAGPGVITGAVRLLEHLGSDLYAHVDVPGQDAPLIARLPAEDEAASDSGATLHLRLRLEHVLLFAPNGRRLRPAEAKRVMPLPLREPA